MEQTVVQQVVNKPIDWTEKFVNHMQDLAMTKGIDFLQAVIIAIIGYFVCRWIRRVIHNVLARSAVEDSAVTFVTEIIYFLCLLIVALMALGTMGVSTTSLSAALGGIGLGIGLALKDKIGNVASGIFILIFKPFRVGDYINAAGNSGTVTNIRIMYTELATAGNQVVVIPNLTMTGSIVTNYSMRDVRNVEMNIGVGYDTDLPACLALLRELFRTSPYVVDKDKILIYVKNFGDSSINLYISVGVERTQYFKAMSDLYIEVKNLLEIHGIDIPYPQMVVHKKP